MILMDLSDQQVFAHIDTILRHFYQQSIISDFFIQMTKSYHINTCHFGSCWETLRSPPYVSAPWIKSTLNFLTTISMTLKIPRIHVLQPLREQDTSIMATLSSSTLTAKEIKIINNTRIFLKVTSLAEIINNQGTSIHQAYITDQPPKRRTNLNGTSTLIWPKLSAPNRRMWRFWLKGLKHFCKPSSCILKTALGMAR
jgi:hypothetical protein